MLKGVDISNWQNVGAGGGVDFVICKATEGDGYVDPKCDAHYQRAKKNGQLLGVYHFARPDLGNTAEAEAEWFVKNIKGYIGEAILVLDWEVNTNNTVWAKAFLDKVYALTGVRPLIYMSASVVNGNDWSAVAKADYGLWIAGYPAKYNVANPPTPSVDDMPYGTGAWGFWAIWQYSSSAGALDLDIANMDAEAWKKYAGKSGGSSTTPTTSTKPTTSTPSKDYEEYTVQSGDTLSAIASRYGTTYQKIAQDNGISNPNVIFAGQKLKIYKSGGSSNSRTVDYAVRQGDTLSGIASRYGTTWQKIASDNGLENPNFIVPGQRLIIKL